MSDQAYPLAPEPVFRTFQGEGVLAGTPMVFIRLAGCPVGCPGCDTDYSVAGKATAAQIAASAASVKGNCRWAWITGGEPAIHDLGPLISKLRGRNFRVGISTSGIIPVKYGFSSAPEKIDGVEFLSVSPHSAGETWVHRRGDQVNLVPGLNGLKLDDFRGVDFSGFSYRYVTPYWIDGKPSNTDECIAWAESNAGWNLGIQGHKHWGVK